MFYDLETDINSSSNELKSHMGEFILIIIIKTGLRTLNEMVASQTAFMVWKSYKAKDCLGRTLFPKRSIQRTTRSINCLKATQPVPGNNTLAANLMARAWNSSTELHNVTTIGAAKSLARKWAKDLVYCRHLP